jgi:predicted metal-dependent peptidase
MATAIDIHRRGIKTFLIQCDADIQYTGELTRESLTSLEKKGGGGTAFAPPFEYILEKNIQPELVFYLTDGYNWDHNNTIEASEKIKSRIIWLITEDGKISKDYPGESYQAGKDFHIK